MNIILEGPDGSGKSTLANHLSEALGWPIIKSEGPEKYSGEIHKRLDRLLTQFCDSYIFDRHAVISQRLYSLVHKQTPPSERHENEFYKMDNFFIYCRPNDILSLNSHVKSEVDTEEYINLLEDNYEELVKAYDDWAVIWAHVIYRIGDNTNQLIGMIKGVLSI